MNACRTVCMENTKNRITLGNSAALKQNRQNCKNMEGVRPAPLTSKACYSGFDGAINHFLKVGAKLHASAVEECEAPEENKASAEQDAVARAKAALAEAEADAKAEAAKAEAAKAEAAKA